MSTEASSASLGTKRKDRPLLDSPNKGLNIAFEGCCHGELDKIYATLKRLEETNDLKIDLLICCGDFQAVRNLDDLECMSVPNKYKRLMTFYKYYNGSEVAPYPTLFIGGNHEATNYLRELYYGGWVAPNIYFLGCSGVINFGGLRIAGISGIYNERHYRMGYYEQLPYNEGTKRSVYHVREFDTYKLKQIKRKVDVFLSHDWPDCVTEWGDTEKLLKTKPYFAKEVEDNALGSPVNTELLMALKPDYYFAAHLHVKFPALVEHENGRTTRFLALDKCLPRRDFLQVLNFPDADGPKEFRYDNEWLDILKRTMPLMSLVQHQPRIPTQNPATVEDMNGDLATVKVPNNFMPTALGHDESGRNKKRKMPVVDLKNPQTEEFLQMLGVPYNLYFGHSRQELIKTERSAKKDLTGFSQAEHCTTRDPEKDTSFISFEETEEDL